MRTFGICGHLWNVCTLKWTFYGICGLFMQLVNLGLPSTCVISLFELFCEMVSHTWTNGTQFCVIFWNFFLQQQLHVIFLVKGGMDTSQGRRSKLITNMISACLTTWMVLLLYLGILFCNNLKLFCWKRGLIHPKASHNI
jgi:hypothetical protein